MTKNEIFNGDSELMGLEQELANARLMSNKTPTDKKAKRARINSIEGATKARKKLLRMEAKKMELEQAKTDSRPKPQPKPAYHNTSHRHQPEITLSGSF